MENMLDTTYNAYRRSYFKPEARAETYIPQYEIEFVKYLKQITEKLERISNFNATVSSYLIMILQKMLHLKYVFYYED